MRTFEAVAEAFVAEGIEVVFGLLGGGNDGLIWELQQRGVRFVPSRHEQGAVGMADGYSRATGKTGLAAISHGPGLSNAATPLITAKCSRSNLLVFVSDTEPGHRHSNMKFDQQPFIHATAGALQQLDRPELVTESVELCFRHLRVGAGPIVLNVPDDVVEQEMPDGWRYMPTGLANPPLHRIVPDAAEVAQLAELIRAAERPVILAGRGAVWSDAHDVLVELADRMGAVVATTLLARSFFRGHPFDLGISGGFAPPSAAALLAEADLVVAFGASLSHETVVLGQIRGDGTKLVQVDLDREMASDQTVADRIFVGDAKSTAEAVLAYLGDEVLSGWRTDEIKERVDAIDRFEGIDLTEDTDGFLNLYLAYKTCDALLPEERLLFVDGGYFMGGPPTQISVLEPRDQVLPWRFGAIGGATGPAIGGAVGRPDRVTVLFTGDGGLMMNIQEIDTAVRCKVPLIIFVIDNGGFAMERPRYRTRVGWDPDMADYDNPDFGAVATALGFDGFTPESNDELAEILTRIGTPSRPTLINLRVRRDAPYPELDRYKATKKPRHGRAWGEAEREGEGSPQESVTTAA